MFYGQVRVYLGEVRAVVKHGILTETIDAGHCPWPWKHRPDCLQKLVEVIETAATATATQE